MRGILDAIAVGGECALDDALEYESAQFGLVFSTEDAREGTHAFLERRNPAFRGR
jgi:enoyl-CoA hydratase